MLQPMSLIVLSMRQIRQSTSQNHIYRCPISPSPPQPVHSNKPARYARIHSEINMRPHFLLISPPFPIMAPAGYQCPVFQPQRLTCEDNWRHKDRRPMQGSQRPGVLKYRRMRFQWKKVQLTSMCNATSSCDKWGRVDACRF